MNPLNTLKQQLLEAVHLSEPVNYFLQLLDQDIVAASPGHCVVENVAERIELIEAIRAVEHSVQLPISDQEFFEVPKEHFFHGICVSPGDPMPLMVLYFSDVQTGICARVEEGAQHRLVRFSLKGEGVNA